MTVYLDTAFLLNFCINLCLLRGTARLGASAAPKKRLVLGAAVGAAYAVAVFLPGCGWLRSLPLRALSAAAMLLCAFGLRRSTLRLGAVFAAVTLVLCGAVYAFGGSPLRATVPSLLLTAFAVELACRLLLPRLTHGGVVPVTLRLGSRSVRLTALQDTGNTLCDPVSGAPVLVAHWRAARALLPLALRGEDFSAPAALALRLRDYSPRLIPFRAVGTASGLLLAIPCDITISNATRHGLVAFSPTPLSDGGAYDALTGGILC